MKKYKIFNARLANALVKKGFSIIGTEPNMKHPQFDVFLFEDSPAFRSALNNMQERKNEEQRVHIL